MVNLVQLNMYDFDIILGMNWLSSYHAHIDCYGKKVVFQIPGELEFNFQGDTSIIKSRQPESPPLFISTMRVRKAIRKGCEAFLAYVMDTQRKETTLEDIPIISKLLDVFPDELPGLPPDREIEFEINILPRIGLISKLPYRMAPTELWELKTQLQKLLNKP